MTRTQVLVQFDAEQVAALDRVVANMPGSNRSELIRGAVDLYLEAVDEAVHDVRYARAYKRLPEDLHEHEAFLEAAIEVWPV